MGFLLVLQNDEAIGEVDNASIISDYSGEWLKITINNDLFNKLINFKNNYLFFIVSKDSCIQVSEMVEYHIIENKDWFNDNLTLKIRSLVLDEHFVGSGTHFYKIYKSWYRDKKIELICGAH